MSVRGWTTAPWLVHDPVWMCAAWTLFGASPVMVTLTVSCPLLTFEVRCSRGRLRRSGALLQGHCHLIGAALDLTARDRGELVLRAQGRTVVDVHIPPRCRDRRDPVNRGGHVRRAGRVGDNVLERVDHRGIGRAVAHPVDVRRMNAVRRQAAERDRDGELVARHRQFGFTTWLMLQRHVWSCRPKHADEVGEALVVPLVPLLPHAASTARARKAGANQVRRRDTGNLPKPVGCIPRAGDPRGAYGLPTPPERHSVSPTAGQENHLGK